MKSIKTILLFTTFILLSTVQLFAQKSKFNDSAKKYKTKYADQLNEGEKIKNSWYHYVTTETENKEYFARVFYPDTKQITSYEQYKSKKFKTKSGITKKWSDDGVLKSEGFHKENKRIGLWKYYNRKEGYLDEMGTYKEGDRIGVWHRFNSAGDTLSRYTYEQGIRHGAFIEYDSLGQVYNQGFYNNDTIFSETRIDTMSHELVEVDEEFPMFKDASCDEIEIYKDRKRCADTKMLQYIYKNLKYPAKARNLGIQGRVITQFVVSKEGKIKDINILNGICDELKYECIRVIENMPIWNPGSQDDKPVNVMFTLPILFRFN